MTGFLRGYDSAFPIPNPPAWEVALVYIGGVGLTPHVWTDPEITAQPVQFINPTWVCRLDPALDTAAQGEADADFVVAWMNAHGAEPGDLCTLDTETLILPAYIAAFDRRIVANGFTCMNYGSLSYVTKNPLTSGGRFSADWRDIPQIDPGFGIVATQYANESQLGKPYDASLYTIGLNLMVKPGTVEEEVIVIPGVPGEWLSVQVLSSADGTRQVAIGLGRDGQLWQAVRSNGTWADPVPV